MASATKILVVNADDFGLSEGINRGILSAFDEGILRSTSIMPNGPAFDDAISIARATPELGVGIHLSLVDEKCLAPVSKIGALASEDGSLPASYGAFVKSWFGKKFRPEHVFAEIDAQVDRVLSASIKPTHIDSHQHLHIFPGIFDYILKVAKSHNIEVVRIPWERDPTAKDRLVQKMILSALCRSAAKKAERAGVRTVDSFWGFSLSGHMNESNLTQTVSKLRPGVNEIMCHPGFSDPTTSTRYQWGYEWDAEAAGLRSEPIRRLLDEQDIKLKSFRGAW